MSIPSLSVKCNVCRADGRHQPVYYSTGSFLSGKAARAQGVTRRHLPVSLRRPAERPLLLPGRGRRRAAGACPAACRRRRDGLSVCVSSRALRHTVRGGGYAVRRSTHCTRRRA